MAYLPIFLIALWICCVLGDAGSYLAGAGDFAFAHL